MSTLEDFENAPVGATATNSGGRAMKLGGGRPRWIFQNGSYLTSKEMEDWGYTLDPAPPWTARESLDLAWELAHEVKEWHVIPEGTRYLEHQGSGLKENRARCDFNISPGIAPRIRTLDPLPDPEPDWLDAPAVLANEPGTGKRGVFIPTDKDTGKHWEVVFSALSYHWSELEDVTPLYPKEGQEA